MHETPPPPPFLSALLNMHSMNRPCLPVKVLSTGVSATAYEN